MAMILQAQSTALAGLGKSLPRRQAQRARRVATAAAAEGTSKPLWFPGNEPAPGLDEELPGYYGFDPLAFIQDEESKNWYQQAELVHCRICMTSAAGILLPGLASATGAYNFPPWYSAGKVWLERHPGFPLESMLFVQLLLIGWVESKRWADLKNPGSQGDGSFFGITDDFKPQSNGYPGGKLFDPLGFSRGKPETLQEYKTKEVKNGRLAILANLGFAAQYAATRTDPITNLRDHLSEAARSVALHQSTVRPSPAPVVQDPTHINFTIVDVKDVLPIKVPNDGGVQTNNVSLPFYQP